MGYSSVQVIGRTAAVKAFQNTDCVNWCLMQGRQLLFKYEGNDKQEGGTQLEALLKMIAESSGSDAIYTLRWFERDDIPEPRPGRPVKVTAKKFKIYENTPFDGSFNFKLFDQDGEQSPRRQSWQDVQTLREEIAELKKAIAARNQEDSELEKEPGGIAGVINGLMEVPEIKAAIAGKVIQLFDGLTNRIGAAINPGQAQLPAKIAGPVPGQAPAAEPIQLPADQVNQLNAALTILVKADSGFSAHLYKLAMIAQNDIGTYNSLISMLNNMK